MTTASKAYGEVYETNEALLSRLHDALLNATVDARQANWADVGTLTQVRDHLRQALGAIGDTSDEEEDAWGL